MSGLGVVYLKARPLLPSDWEGIAARLATRSSTGTQSVHRGHVLMLDATDTVRASSQPWTEPTDGVPVDVVADVHLSNRRRLLARMRMPTSTSDRQIVRATYLREGLRGLDSLEGEFAYAVLDGRTGVVHLGVDPLATRELYVAAADGVILASTELLALLTHPDVDSAPDEVGIANYLIRGRVLRAGMTNTAYASIERLLPGHRMTLRPDGSRTTIRWWDVPVDVPMTRTSTPQDLVVQFREILQEAVVDRLDDVPRAAVALSGGLDSTAISALAMDAMRDGRVTTQLQAITVVYDRLAPDDEAFYAGLAAARSGLPLTYLPLDEYTMTRPVELRAEPLADPFSGRARRIVRATAELGPLVLTGKHADEVLTQTPLHRVLNGLSWVKAAELYSWLWRWEGSRPGLGGRRDFVRGLLRRPVDVGWASESPPAWINPDFARRVDFDARWHAEWTQEPASRHPTQPDLPRNLGQARGGIREQFMTPDPGVVAAEATYPFADMRLIRFLLALPPSPWNVGKSLLRGAMHGLVPSEILERRKTPAPPVERVLLHREDARWVESWRASTRLSPFVREDALPNVYGAQDMWRAVIDSRPLFLDEWLRAIGGT